MWSEKKIVEKLKKKNRISTTGQLLDYTKNHQGYTISAQNKSRKNSGQAKVKEEKKNTRTLKF